MKKPEALLSLLFKLGNLKRRVFHPEWWICEWKVDPRVSNIIRQSGQFVALGKTIEQAEEDAKKMLENQVFGKANVTYTIRRPSLWSRIFGG